MKKYESPLTVDEVAAVGDKDIEFSDIPELDDDFWHDAELIEPDTDEQISMRNRSGRRP